MCFAACQLGSDHQVAAALGAMNVLLLVLLAHKSGKGSILEKSKRANVGPLLMALLFVLLPADLARLIAYTMQAADVRQPLIVM